MFSRSMSVSALRSCVSQHMHIHCTCTCTCQFRLGTHVQYTCTCIQLHKLYIHVSTSTCTCTCTCMTIRNARGFNYYVYSVSGRPWKTFGWIWMLLHWSPPLQLLHDWSSSWNSQWWLEPVFLSALSCQSQACGSYVLPQHLHTRCMLWCTMYM